ncbi:MAG: hypothetical protein ACE5K4_04095 [Candidatus Hydrothermarchaeota archaeon]
MSIFKKMTRILKKEINFLYVIDSPACVEYFNDVYDMLEKNDRLHVLALHNPRDLESKSLFEMLRSLSIDLPKVKSFRIVECNISLARVYANEIKKQCKNEDINVIIIPKKRPQVYERVSSLNIPIITV